MKVEKFSALGTGHLYPPGNIPDTHFCNRLSRLQGLSAAGRIITMKNSYDTAGNQTRDLPACNIHNHKCKIYVYYLILIILLSKQNWVNETSQLANKRYWCYNVSVRFLMWEPKFQDPRRLIPLVQLSKLCKCSARCRMYFKQDTSIASRIMLHHSCILLHRCAARLWLSLG
jgi:hypothetical protein